MTDARDWAYNLRSTFTGDEDYSNSEATKNISNRRIFEPRFQLYERPAFRSEEPEGRLPTEFDDVEYSNAISLTDETIERMQTVEIQEPDPRDEEFLKLYNAYVKQYSPDRARRATARQLGREQYTRAVKVSLGRMLSQQQGSLSTQLQVIKQSISKGRRSTEENMKMLLTIHQKLGQVNAMNKNELQMLYQIVDNMGLSANPEDHGLEDTYNYEQLRRLQSNAAGRGKFLLFALLKTRELKTTADKAIADEEGKRKIFYSLFGVLDRLNINTRKNTHCLDLDTLEIITNEKAQEKYGTADGKHSGQTNTPIPLPIQTPVCKWEPRGIR